MNKAQESHLHTIKQTIVERIDKKYRAGQKAHGGDLWKKDHVLEMLLQEIDDLVVYAHTLKQQLKNRGIVKSGFRDSIILPPGGAIPNEPTETLFITSFFPKANRKKASKKTRK